jgi:hypothetical protein
MWSSTLVLELDHISVTVTCDEHVRLRSSSHGANVACRNQERAGYFLWVHWCSESTRSVGEEMAIWRGARAEWFHGIAKPLRDSESHVSQNVVLRICVLRVCGVRKRRIRVADLII